jgi:iron(III) transport system permease protein
LGDSDETRELKITAEILDYTKTDFTPNQRSGAHKQSAQDTKDGVLIGLLRRSKSLYRLGSLSFWMVLFLAIIIPCLSFLVLAISPRLFDQGSQFFTLENFKAVFSGSTLVALTNSLWVASLAALVGIFCALPMAWLFHRSDLPFKKVFSGAIWLVLLIPSWIPAIGWERFVNPDGILFRLHLWSPWQEHLIMGPFGVVLLLGLRNIPFSYLAVSNALAGLGQEFEHSAQVHGASKFQTAKLVVPILFPAILSGLAIGFAEAISDFGVAATLAYTSHFTLATYYVYQQIGNFPPDFPLAAAFSWLLVLAVAIPLYAQAKLSKGRSYQVLSGRTRQPVMRKLSVSTKVAVVLVLCLFYFVAVGIPTIGVVSSSLLSDFGASLHITFANYKAVFTTAGLGAPLERSIEYAAITASITVLVGFVAARKLSKTKGTSAKVLDFILLSSVAIPGIIFAAGYIFAYNLPFLSKIGINLYQTTTLLVIAYIATSLPTNVRMLFGSVSQVADSLSNAARVHGAGAIRSWMRAILPPLSRPIVTAWLLAFTGILLELPVSELLYAPGFPPASIAIQDNLGNYHFGIGMAQTVVATMVAFAVVGTVFILYRLLAPRGWRRIGGILRA